MVLMAGSPGAGAMLIGGRRLAKSSAAPAFRGEYFVALDGVGCGRVLLVVDGVRLEPELFQAPGSCRAVVGGCRPQRCKRAWGDREQAEHGDTEKWLHGCPPLS